MAQSVSASPALTPTKDVHFMSPSGNNICFICQKVIEKKQEKVNLFSGSSLSTHGKVIESAVGVELSHESDFGCVDRNCWRQIKNLNEKRKLLQEKLSHGENHLS